MRISRKIVLVTRQTRLAGLRRKFNTAGQAKFYVMQAARQLAMKDLKGADVETLDRLASAAVADYVGEDDLYQRAIATLRDELAELLPVQAIDRDLLPTFFFDPEDIVVTVGQDGLVANTAKYAIGLPIVAVNPDPERFDGILMPFAPQQALRAVQQCLQHREKVRHVTLAEAVLNDGQRLLAFNDFLVGCRTHTSARYKITAGNRTEPQSSSGILVSTGAGSSGWLSSVFNMARGLAPLMGNEPAPPPLRLPWEDPRLAFVVREPFASKSSSAEIVSGLVEEGKELTIESQMPGSGTIFSDGIEADFLEFNSGAVARIRAAKERAKLVVPG